MSQRGCVETDPNAPAALLNCLREWMTFRIAPLALKMIHYVLRLTDFVVATHLSDYKPSTSQGRHFSEELSFTKLKTTVFVYLLFIR